MTDTYRVFSRNPWRKVGKGQFVPNPGARRITIATGVTLEEARRLCADGPANMLRAAGKEYRHKPFHEFMREE